VINRLIEEIIQEPFFEKFTALGTSQTWRPAGAHLCDAVEVRLESNRKGECTECQLRLRGELLTHPLLADLSIGLCRDFFQLTLPEVPNELRAVRWVKELSNETVRCGKLQVVRQQEDGNQCFVVRPGPGFLAGLFHR
jgi:hypothetical protein